MVAVPLRSAHCVMKLARLGSAHQGRLSFMRVLLRRLKRENWQFTRSVWEINDQGVGRAVYQAKGPEHTYSLVAFAHDLPDELRSDRVIAHAWDATFALFDGVPNAQDLQRLEANVPKQEAGRVSEKEICLSRANRSVRLFDAVVNALAQGQQPNAEQLATVGYLMRTTAVYGSAKFGLADREQLSDRPECRIAFQMEMLSVWLIRAFTVDLVEHLAKAKGGSQAVTIEPSIRRGIGVGNSTGLGMAPFLVNHPRLLNYWLLSRETAIARVRSLDSASEAEYTHFCEAVTRAEHGVDQWHSNHPQQAKKIRTLRVDLSRLQRHLSRFRVLEPQPWNRLYQWAEAHTGLDAQELLCMLMLEPYGELVDELANNLWASESQLALIDTRWQAAQLAHYLERHYAWALNTDYRSEPAQSRFWYVSEEKQEPRLGERFEESGHELEQPLAIGRDGHALYRLCLQQPREKPLSECLKLPEFRALRHVLRRVQQAEHYPYMEVQDNVIAAELLPIDMLRLKLAFFGATKFDPRSDRWLRITLFQHAPFPHELSHQDPDDWSYPQLAPNRWDHSFDQPA